MLVNPCVQFQDGTYSVLQNIDVETKCRIKNREPNFIFLGSFSSTTRRKAFQMFESLVSWEAPILIRELAKEEVFN